MKRQSAGQGVEGSSLVKGRGYEILKTAHNLLKKMGIFIIALEGSLLLVGI